MDTKIHQCRECSSSSRTILSCSRSRRFRIYIRTDRIRSTDTGLKEGVAAQTKQVLANLGAVLKASDLTLDNVIKTTVFLADINDFAEINEIYEEAFGDNKPARSCVQAGALPKGALIEIEVIAVK